jgi:hypothetical protein
MRILTPTGYKDIEDVQIGDELVAFDIQTGEKIINLLEGKDKWTEETDPENQGAFSFYLINGEYLLYKNQSIWANDNVTHAQFLKKGDIIYNNNNEEIKITSIKEGSHDEWWRLTVSGDHSYIADGLLLHNASRFWKGDHPTNNNWNQTGSSTTNWASTSGGASGASVPGSSDDVTIDGGTGGNGNNNGTISATITILSLTFTSAYTATQTRNAGLTVGGNVTLRPEMTWAGASAMTINAASTITSNGVTWDTNLNLTGANTKILSGNLAVSGVFGGNTSTINATVAETLTASGGLSITGGSISGTAKIILTGGTWTCGAGIGVGNNMDFQGNVTVSGTVRVTAGTHTYISGTITTTGSTLALSGNCTLNLSGITWADVSVGNFTITLSSDFDVGGDLIFTNTSATATVNSQTINVSGSLTMNSLTSGTLTGTTVISMNGTGSISMSAVTTGTFRIPLTIASTNITFTASQTFQYSSGTLLFSSVPIFGAGAIIKIRPAAATTITCNVAGLTIPDLRIGNEGAFDTTINGSNGFTHKLYIDEATSGNSNSIIFKFGNTYTISDLTNTRANAVTFATQTTIKSDTGGSKVVTTLQPSAAQNLNRVKFTDVDASGGQTIFSFGTTLSNTTNIRSTPTAPTTVAKTFV